MTGATFANFLESIPVHLEELRLADPQKECLEETSSRLESTLEPMLPMCDVYPNLRLREICVYELQISAYAFWSIINQIAPYLVVIEQTLTLRRFECSLHGLYRPGE